MEGTGYTYLAEFHLKLDNAQRHTEAQESGPAWEESSGEPDGSLAPERLSQEQGDLGIGRLPTPGQRLEGPGRFGRVTSASALKLKLCASEMKWRPTGAQRQAQKFCKQPHYRMT